MPGSRRSSPPRRGQAQGFVLVAMLIILTLGGLYFLVSNLTPEAVEARRQAKTNEALALARDALLGYALKYRDEEAGQGRPDRMYGYLPLPDLGSSRNNNADPNCKDAGNNPLEGCDANTPTGIACDANNIYPTMVGRLPWRTLGTGPIRDGNNECLWLIVSSLHLRKHCGTPTLPVMNWDTLGQLDVVTANGTAALSSALASTHERPVAIIYSPGPPLPGQNRRDLGGNDVTECGGNYDAANYLDPATATALGGVTNYLAGTNKASDITGDSDTSNDPDNAQRKAMLVQGKVFKSGANFLPGGCAASNCELVANDVGLPVTSEVLFGALRKSSSFRNDINSMLDRVASCLRDQIAAGPGFAPDAMSNFTAPGDKSAGRVPASTCYDDAQNPQGYFTHWRDQMFVARANTGTLAVTVDGITQACPAVLLFGAQRGPGQSRDSAVARGSPSNYLENDNLGDAALTTTDNNLASFGTDGLTSFAGPGTFGIVSAANPAQRDIVRCIPAGASFTSVSSPTLAALGFSQLSSYDPGTRTLTLGALGVTTGTGAPGYALYGCSWTPETHLTKTGLRAYFRFAIVERGDGFVFAMVDGDRNSANVCGAARQQLGYSGNNDPDQSSNGLLPSVPNNETPILAHPKIGIEFDNTKATGTYGTSGDPTTAGRNDPCYASGSCPAGANGDNNAHAAIVYWGGESPIATGTACNASNQCPYTGSTCFTLGRCPAVRYCNTSDHMCYLRPEYDDNVHSFPVPPDASARPAPRNPPAPFPPEPVVSPAPGVAALDRLGSTDAAERDFHVRVEVTRAYSDVTTTDPMNRKATVKVETWIVPEGGNTQQIAAMKNTTRAMSQLYPGFVPTLSNDGTRYNEPRGACVLGACPAGQTCDGGTCYTSGPPVVHDLPMGACDAQHKCSGPPSLKHSACVAGACPAGSGQSCGADNYCYDALYSCGSDDVCYAESFRTMRLGFTNGQGTQAQIINISDFFATWLP